MKALTGAADQLRQELQWQYPIAAGAPVVSTSTARPTLAKLDAALDDPFYRGFELYVHRQGVKPVGFHVARMLDRNPRTPYRIELALHNLHTTLFERYVAYQLRICGNR